MRNRRKFIQAWESPRLPRYEWAGIQGVTPKFAASPTQRSILEGWTGLFYEYPPGSPTTATVTLQDTESPFYRGVIYVPSPLGYVSGTNPQADVNRICQAISNYPPQNVAAFYYHAFLEFPFIHISGSTVTYDDNSYLKQLIRCFKQQGYTFVPLLSYLSFVPSIRQTNFFADNGYIFLTGDINGDSKSEFIVWQPANGYWYYALTPIDELPSRRNSGLPVNLALTDWR